MEQTPTTQPTSDLEPYAAPQAELAPRESTALAYQQHMERVMASRGERLAAFAIDLSSWTLSIVAWIVAATILESAVGMASALLTLVIPLSLFAYNLYLLADNAQTLGKKLLGIKIVRSDMRTQASIWRILFFRYLPVNLLSNIPCFGHLILIANYLMIFRDDQKCGHDHIADTHVVEEGVDWMVEPPPHRQPPTSDRRPDSEQGAVDEAGDFSRKFGDDQFDDLDDDPWDSDRQW